MEDINSSHSGHKPRPVSRGWGGEAHLAGSSAITSRLPWRCLRGLAVVRRRWGGSQPHGASQLSGPYPCSYSCLYFCSFTSLQQRFIKKTNILQVNPVWHSLSCCSAEESKGGICPHNASAAAFIKQTRWTARQMLPWLFLSVLMETTYFLYRKTFKSPHSSINPT